MVISGTSLISSGPISWTSFSTSNSRVKKYLRVSCVYGPCTSRSLCHVRRPSIRRKSLRFLSTSQVPAISFLNSSMGSIHAFSSSFWIIAAIDLSSETIVHTQQPKRLLPQLGVDVSSTNGHSPSAEAPLYIANKSLFECPQGLGYCTRYCQTLSLLQSSIGVKT